MKGRFEKDYNGETIECFAPDPTIIAVTSGSAVTVSGYSVVVFDQDTDLIFNGVASPSYAEWPAHMFLQVSSGITSITTSVNCNMMVMKNS